MPECVPEGSRLKTWGSRGQGVDVASCACVGKAFGSVRVLKERRRDEKET